MEIGIDIVDIADLRQKTELSALFLSKLLHQSELKGVGIESIAGKIAAKEAIIKTGYMKVGDWLNLKIINDETGKPYATGKDGTIIKNLKISISHVPNYAAAIAILI